MGDPPSTPSNNDPELKEKKRKKALRRMGKIVGQAWNLSNSGPFQTVAANNKSSSSSESSSSIFCLTSLGQKVDDQGYRGGRHGWEDFARDIGGVYNRHIHRKLKNANLAKEHLEQVCAMLGKIDQSLVSAAQEHVPSEARNNKKRKAASAAAGDVTGGSSGGDGGSSSTKAAKKRRGGGGGSNPTTISEREDQAMENLMNFIEEKGGTKDAVENFRCSVTQKPSNGRYDTTFYNDNGKRFRSMVEVARHLGLVAEQNKRSAAGMKRVGLKKKKSTSKEIEAEKKKLRKELEKLQKTHTKATKALDDFLTDDKDAQYPIDDTILQEEVEASSGGPPSSRILPTNCAAARIPDIDSFEGLPQHCMPDVLVAWDFLCTFTRAISVNPISLDDFIHCLNYKPPKNLSDSDALNAPPIYLGEAHLGLLKLVLADRSSDDWWWSILETPVSENAIADFGDTADKEESDLPLIKVDFAALLGDTEEPLITTSWLQALRNVQYMKSNDAGPIKSAIKTAMGIVANKWVMAYLKKAIKLGQTSGPGFMKRAVVWLSDRVREARPDLLDRSIGKDEVFKKRAKVVEEVSQQMDKLSSAALTVNDDDLLSDAEDSDDDSDDSDVEDDKENTKDAAPVSNDEPDDRPSSYIPQKPSPSLVDFLLPPGKPIPPSELLNPSSWPHLAGAAACRILHRYRRLRNEVDDSLRDSRDLPKLTVKQRREREELFKSRVLTEFAVDAEGKDPSKRAVEHLCAGGNYLDLTPLERLCLLRILIEAAYDTHRVYEVVDSNHKQRTNAVKALETERRKAKREAKEKAAEDESIARQDLSLEARRNFIEEKREEIRKANEANHELTNDEIDELTEEDIIEFDDDIKADFEALPTPESYKKAEVVARVATILEAAAFETELLTVLTMDEVLERENAHQASLEESLEALGGEDALMDPQLDRDTYRAIEKLRRELAKIQSSSETLPQQRETAIETLKEAITDGTIKSLRGSIRAAKAARLFGRDEHTNGIWALDIVRDAHMELENAKQLKRVADAQKDLVSKRNKCFIRTEPLGSDRFRNRFWRFENSEQGHVWSEVDHVISQTNTAISNQPNFLKIVATVDQVAVGHPDIEEDFAPSEGAYDDADRFRLFTRREYHQSGASASLAKRHWGCHNHEASVRALTKGLDSRGVREADLKKNLKEALEERAASTNENSGQAGKEVMADSDNIKQADDEEEADTAGQFDSSGDEALFSQLKQGAKGLQSDIINLEVLDPLSSGIGQNVRLRIVVERTKDSEIASYEVGSITGWKIRKDEVPLELEEDEFEPRFKIVDTPVWRAWTEQGNEIWLTGTELLESICRYSKWKSKENYFESDAAFLSYRNALGRHFGRAAEAAHAMTPIRFTQYMVKREAEIYQKLKHHVFDNTWGGKNGSRNAWITSMRDFAFDFETAKEGLLTLENALLELTGGFPDDAGDGKQRSARELLDDPKTREDIELESLENGVNGLWNAQESREVFIEIVKGSKTVGFLELALELLCRNTRFYMEANKIQTVSTQETSYGSSMRTARRANAWQQQSDPFFYGEAAPSTRRTRNANVFYGGME